MLFVCCVVIGRMLMNGVVFVVCCLLFDCCRVSCEVFVVCCVLFAVDRSLFVVCRLLIGV